MEFREKDYKQKTIVGERYVDEKKARKKEIQLSVPEKQDREEKSRVIKEIRMALASS